MRKDSIEKINYKGYEIETFQDENADGPQDWGNTDTFLVYEHRDFTVNVDGFDPDEIFAAMQSKQKMFDGHFYFPVFAYIHSGVSLSLGKNEYPFTCPWDVSFKGFALVKRQKGAWSRDAAYKMAKGLLSEWNMYLSGDVYGYNSDCGSCWGFYGKDGYKQMIAEAKSEIDYKVSETIKEHLNELKGWILSKVNFMYRKPLQISAI